MDDKKVKIKVGLTILVGLVILILGYYWLRNFQFRKEYHFYRVKFSKIGWVNKGDLVTVMGVPKGRIEDIQLYGDSVIIVARLEGIRLRRGATATLVSLGIIGQMRLSFTLGDGPPLPDYSTIIGHTQKDMGEVVSEMGELLASSDSVIAYGIKLMSQTSSVLKVASEKIVETSNRTDSLIDALTGLMVDLRGVVKDLSPQVKKSIASADSTSKNLNKLITDLDSLTIVMLKSEGTLGKLIQNDSLYYSMDSTLRSLKALLEDIKAHPKKYVQIKIF